MSPWCSPLLALALATGPQTPSVQVRLEDDLTCGLGASLPAALEQQQVRIATPENHQAWALSIAGTSSGGQLRISTPQGVVRGERPLALGPADCPALPRTVALLVKSWLVSGLGESELPITM